MTEININELRDTMISEGKEQEFKELMMEYSDKKSQAKYIEYLGQIDKENKLILTTIFDIDKETHSFIKVLDLRENEESIAFYFLGLLQDIIYSNIHVKYALLHPNSVRQNRFEIAIENNGKI